MKAFSSICMMFRLLKLSVIECISRRVIGLKGECSEGASLGWSGIRKSSMCGRVSVVMKVRVSAVLEVDCLS